MSSTYILPVSLAPLSSISCFLYPFYISGQANPSNLIILLPTRMEIMEKSIHARDYRMIQG
jgi:hypothetical protein